MMWNSRALVFDLDDTLYSESSYFAAVFAVFCSSQGWPNSSFAPLMENFRYLRLTQKDLFGFFLDQNLSLWRSSDASAINEYRESLHSALFSLYTGIKTNLKPMNGAAAWMEFAHENGLKVGVLTNGVAAVQRNKWACLDIPYKAQTTLLPARECKREKPYPEAFQAISQSLEIDINKITFLGDRFENDLAYPLSQGATGILLSQEPDPIWPCENWCSAPDLVSALSLIVQKSAGQMWVTNFPQRD